MCPITDVHDWTDWFHGIMGAPAAAQDITDQAVLNIAASLHERHAVPVDDMTNLNNPFTLDEIVEVFQTLPTCWQTAADECTSKALHVRCCALQM
jgi:hypothetical protein